MDFPFPNKKKQKLDFNRTTFAEPEIKLPIKDITNKIDWSMKPDKFNEDDESSHDSEISSSSTTVKETINVFLRLKPCDIPDHYRFDRDTVILKGVQPAYQQQTVERMYKFTSIMNSDTDQATVYNSCVRPILSEPFSSQGAVFSSYGVSNSGKTYTILGENEAGLVPRALAQIFTQFEKQIAVYPCIKVEKDDIAILNDGQVEEEINATQDYLAESRKLSKGMLMFESWTKAIKEDHQFESKESTLVPQQIYIWLSFLEIYNEKMIDLFNRQKSGSTATNGRPLKIFSNHQNSFVQGLTWLSVSNLGDALELLQHGLRQVNYAATGLNAHSSRSHTVFTINIISECDLSYELSSYKFCDLAGAERISKTGAEGERLKEAGGINNSLLVLGRCLEAVQSNQKVDGKKKIVPVRDSKLTLLLQSSLLGRENFVMIVNLLPTLECYEENINVLHFGSIANKIVTRKNQTRKFSRRSSRFSYFMQHSVNGQLNMSHEQVIIEGDESSLDGSFKQVLMTPEDLLRDLRKKELEVNVMKSIIEQKEREFLKRERQLRDELNEVLTSTREEEKNFSEEKVRMKEKYYEQRLQAELSKAQRRFNLQLKNQELEIKAFERENRFLKKKLGMKYDEDVIELGDEEDTCSSDEDEENIVE